MTELRPDLILAGRAPNVLGAMAQGMQLRAARDEMSRQNALGQLYQQHGAGLVNGDKTARNALAAYDPALVLDMDSARLGQQATRQGMTHADETMEMNCEQMRMRIEEVARTNRREDIKAEAQQTARLAEAATLAWDQGEEQFTAFAQANGLDLPYEAWPQAAVQMGAALDMVRDVIGGPKPDYQEFNNNLYNMADPSGPSVVLQGTPDPADREIRENPNGIPRFVDTGDEVFPGVTVQPDPADVATSERDLRKDWEALPEVKNFAGIATAYSTMVSAGALNDGSGDVALITTFM